MSHISSSPWHACVALTGWCITCWQSATPAEHLLCLPYPARPAMHSPPTFVSYPPTRLPLPCRDHVFANKGIGGTSSGIFTACAEQMVPPVSSRDCSKGRRGLRNAALPVIQPCRHGLLVAGKLPIMCWFCRPACPAQEADLVVVEVSCGWQGVRRQASCLVAAHPGVFPPG